MFPSVLLDKSLPKVYALSGKAEHLSLLDSLSDQMLICQKRELFRPEKKKKH